MISQVRFPPFFVNIPGSFDLLFIYHYFFFSIQRTHVFTNVNVSDGFNEYHLDWEESESDPKELENDTDLDADYLLLGCKSTFSLPPTLSLSLLLFIERKSWIFSHMHGYRLLVSA